MIGKPAHALYAHAKIPGPALKYIYWEVNSSKVTSEQIYVQRTYDTHAGPQDS